MKFSVIIPTYNRAHLIGRTIQSVLNQTYTDFEIIVVDDGSTDNTREVVESFKDERIRYFWQENKERGAARNYGIREAKGDYVIFFDSDDIMLDNNLRTLFNAIKKYPEVEFITTKYILINNGKKKSTVLSNFKEGFYTGEIFLKGQITGIMVCIKKNNPDLILFEENRIYATLEDWMFLIKNTINKKILILDYVGVYVIDHNERSMRQNNSAIIFKRQIATQWIENNVELSYSQKKMLNAYSLYFCAIHSLLDKDYSKAKDFIRKAIKEIGVKKEFLIFLFKLKIKQWLKL